MCCSVSRYINEDDAIVPMLKMIRDSGRSTFLVTNRLSICNNFHFLEILYELVCITFYTLITEFVCCSLWDYTNIVMSFLCGPYLDDGSPNRFSWLKYFDVVITGRYVSYQKKMFSIRVHPQYHDVPWQPASLICLTSLERNPSCLFCLRSLLAQILGRLLLI